MVVKRLKRHNMSISSDQGGYVLFLTVRCPPIPLIRHGHIVNYDESSHVIGGMFIVECERGYRFTNGQSMAEIFCDERGRWSNIPECSGNLFII